MPSVKFIHPNGHAEILEGAPGSTIMQTATSQGLAGITAECGGNAMCATCHVFLADDAHLFPDMDPTENALLEGTASERTSESRLSCQLTLTADMKLPTVRLPEHRSDGLAGESAMPSVTMSQVETPSLWARRRARVVRLGRNRRGEPF